MIIMALKYKNISFIDSITRVGGLDLIKSVTRTVIWTNMNS